jgi:hypothetical protein
MGWKLGLSKTQIRGGCEQGVEENIRFTGDTRRLEKTL